MAPPSARAGPLRVDPTNLYSLRRVTDPASRAMTTRENLFRPIHKGIRSMVYELGLRLGVVDFTNLAESNAVAIQLRADLTSAVSSCILCLLQAHSRHEERDFFSAVRPFDPDVVDLMMKEHHEIAQRVGGIARTCDELLAISEPARRVEVGDRLTLEANDLFALYLAHLNNEEATLVPVMWERFSDEQLRTLRAQFYNTIPLPRFEEWMRWTLPALNPNELVVLLSGMRTDPPPNRFSDARRLAEETLDPPRWSLLERALSH